MKFILSDPSDQISIFSVNIKADAKSLWSTSNQNRSAITYFQCNEFIRAAVHRIAAEYDQQSIGGGSPATASIRRCRVISGDKPSMSVCLMRWGRWNPLINDNTDEPSADNHYRQIPSLSYEPSILYPQKNDAGYSKPIPFSVGFWPYERNVHQEPESTEEKRARTLAYALFTLTGLIGFAAWLIFLSDKRNAGAIGQLIFTAVFFVSFLFWAVFLAH